MMPAMSLRPTASLLVLTLAIWAVSPGIDEVECRLGMVGCPRCLAELKVPASDVPAVKSECCIIRSAPDRLPVESHHEAVPHLQLAEAPGQLLPIGGHVSSVARPGWIAGPSPPLAGRNQPLLC